MPSNSTCYQASPRQAGRVKSPLPAKALAPGGRHANVLTHHLSTVTPQASTSRELTSRSSLNPPSVSGSA